MIFISHNQSVHTHPRPPCLKGVPYQLQHYTSGAAVGKGMLSPDDAHLASHGPWNQTFKVSVSEGVAMVELGWFILPQVLVFLVSTADFLLLQPDGMAWLVILTIFILCIK